MTDSTLIHMRRIRSFVRRDSRMTEAQRRAFDELWPEVGLELENPINYFEVFQREAPRILEIGFGSGHSLLAMAKTHPNQDFIGIETHLPGIGALMQGIQTEEIKNIRIYYADAVEVLHRSIPEKSLDTIQIFFPDPWPKRRHHKRRLIQSSFVNLITTKLKIGGTLHLATDWEHYGQEMMKVLSEAKELRNLAGDTQFANRSSQRPIVTKFEQRGKASGRQIWELQFSKEA